MGKKVAFPAPALPLDSKNVAHLKLGTEPPHLPAFIPHKHPILRTLFLAYHFVSGWIPSVSETQRTWGSISLDTGWAILIKKKKKKSGGFLRVAQGVMNPTSIYEDVGSIPSLTQWG